MAKNNKILVPESREQLDQFKVNVMKDRGLQTDPANPDDVKFEVAKELEIPLTKYNGELTARQAGVIGGTIGGSMVKEMIRLAQEQLAKK